MLRGRGQEMRLEFNMDLAMCLYPRSSGVSATEEELCLNNCHYYFSHPMVATLNQCFTVCKVLSINKISFWSDVDLKLCKGTMPVDLFLLLPST